MVVNPSRVFQFALFAAWALGCGGRAGDADGSSGSASEPPSEPELLADVLGSISRLREGSGYVWWLRGGQLERVAKAGGAVEAVARADVYTVADDQIYVAEYSGGVTKYSLGAEVLGQVPLVGGASPSSCDELEARGAMLYCANGRGVFRSIELSSDWLALGTSAEFLASGLALSSSHAYWMTTSLQRVPLGGGATELLGPALPTGIDVLGDRVFFSSNTSGLAGVYEYSESDGLVGRSSRSTWDLTVIESGFYALEVPGGLRWYGFGSARPRSFVEQSVEPTLEVEADASHVYYVEFGAVLDAPRSRILRREHL